QRNAQALLEHRKALAEVGLLKAAIKTLEGIQGDMVAAAFADILRTVNRVTAAIGMVVEYRDGQLGRWSGPTWIGHETFSGTEKALTYAGSSLALAKESPVKVVLLDEMGRMDPEAVRRVLMQMAVLVSEGELGQFIGAYSGTVDPATVPGVNVIALP